MESLVSTNRDDSQIRLRPVEPADLDFTRANRSLPEIRVATLGRVFPVTPENELNWYQTLGNAPFPRSVYLIACGEDSWRVGAFQLAEINWVSRTAWLGMWVAPQEHGRGFGRTILALGLEYAYRTLGLRQIRLEVSVTNEVAHALYRSEGFVEEGTLEGAYYDGLNFVDVRIMRHRVDEPEGDEIDHS